MWLSESKEKLYLYSGLVKIKGLNPELLGYL